MQRIPCYFRYAERPGGLTSREAYYYDKLHDFKSDLIIAHYYVFMLHLHAPWRHSVNKRALTLSAFLIKEI